MLALQSVVMLLIFDAVTPGGFRANIDWRIASSSATQDDILALLTDRLPKPVVCKVSSCN